MALAPGPQLHAKLYYCRVKLYHEADVIVSAGLTNFEFPEEPRMNLSPVVLPGAQRAIQNILLPRELIVQLGGILMALPIGVSAPERRHPVRRILMPLKTL